MAATYHHAVARLAVLLICILIYLLASSAEVLIVKEIYTITHIAIPLFCAWCINTYVILELPVYILYRLAYWYEEYHRTEHQHDGTIDQGRHVALLPCTRPQCIAAHTDINGQRYHTSSTSYISPRMKQILKYIGIGCFSTGIVFLRMFGLARMAGSLYVMITNCSVIFNYILIRIFIPTRRLNHWHQLAAILTVLGVICIATAEQKTIETSYVAVGVAAALGAAFLDSLISVTSESALADVHQQKRVHAQQQGLIGILEVSLANGIFPFLLLPLFLPLAPEYQLWSSIYQHIQKHHHMISMIMMSSGLSISKMIDRLSKFELIHLEGAFFFTVMDTFSKAFTASLSIWLFHEFFSGLFLLGTIILTCAGFINGYAAYAEHLHPKKSPQLPHHHTTEEQESEEEEYEEEHEEEHEEFLTPPTHRSYGSIVSSIVASPDTTSASTTTTTTYRRATNIV